MMILASFLQPYLGESTVHVLVVAQYCALRSEKEEFFLLHLHIMKAKKQATSFFGNIENDQVLLMIAESLQRDQALDSAM